MSRPIKLRNVYCLPVNNRFGPLSNGINENNFLKMTVEEYETIRLIDLEEYKQEECAELMNIARTTVQSLYSSARKRLAQSLINGSILIIEGGNYVLCNNEDNVFGMGRCRRHRLRNNI